MTSLVIETQSTAGSDRRGFGVDVGGSGVKGGIVDLDTGYLIGDRYKLPTPQPATPEAVAKTIAAVVKEFGWTKPLGVTAALDGQSVTVLNDADAAGLAEVKFGAGKDKGGVIVLLTFGTGIGSALIHSGVLLPNTEFGHLEVGGVEAEHRAASSVKEKHDWSYKRWAPEVTKVLVAIENALWPDLFIAGGGISRKADKWLPLLKCRTPVVAAALQNTAGIVGAAVAAQVDPTRGISPLSGV